MKKRNGEIDEPGTGKEGIGERAKRGQRKKKSTGPVKGRGGKMNVIKGYNRD